MSFKKHLFLDSVACVCYWLCLATVDVLQETFISWFYGLCLLLAVSSNSWCPSGNIYFLILWLVSRGSWCSSAHLHFFIVLAVFSNNWCSSRHRYFSNLWAVFSNSWCSSIDIHWLIEWTVFSNKWCSSNHRYLLSSLHQLMFLNTYIFLDCIGCV